MAWYKRDQLTKVCDDIKDSLEQISAYREQPYIKNLDGYGDWLKENIESVNIPDQLKMLQNTEHMYQEVKSLMKREQRRRIIAAELSEEEEKGAVKKLKREQRKKEARENSNPYALRGKRHETVEFGPSPTPGTSHQ